MRIQIFKLHILGKVYIYQQVCLFTAFFFSHLRWQLLSKYDVKGKSKAVPLQACSGPEGSRKLIFPDYMTTAQDGGKFVSPTQRPPLPPGNTHGTHFH